MDEFADSTPHDPLVPAPSFDATESASEPTGDSHEQTGAANHMPVEIGTNISGQTNIANVLNQFYDESAGALSFSSEMIAPLTTAVEDELLELVVIDEACVTKMLAHLESHRVLLLTGDRGSGKRTVAKYLATRLARKEHLQAQTQIVGSLQTRVRILMRKVAAEGLIAGNRIAIFVDVLAGRNSDLMTFFTSDRSAWEQLGETLRTHDTYWIFTTSDIELQPIRDQLTDHLVCHEVPLGSSEAIEMALDRKLAWLQRQRQTCTPRIEILRGHRDRITREIKPLPNMITFIEDFIRRDDTFDAALDSLANKSSAFLSELADDADAWCSALTLALCDAVPGEAVAWTEFERLRRVVTDRIKSDPEIFPRRRPRGDELSPPASGATLMDDLLLKRCRAKVTKDAAGLRDVIEFEQKERSADIWDAVLNCNRRVLLLVLPVLRAIAENTACTIRLRVRAAQMLGRIGEIDAPTLTLPLIQREWVETGDFVLHPLIGRVLEGVLAAGNGKYQHLCLGALEDLASPDPEQKLDEAMRNRLGAAIAAYSQLGGYAAVRAMEHLGEIALDHCAPSVEKAHELFLLAERAERDRSTARSKRHAEILRRSRNGLGHEARRRLALEAPLLFALEQALVYLCFENDPVRTLAATRDWISKGGLSAATVVMLLFLRNGGIADRLEGMAFQCETERGTASINPLIASAAQNGDAIRLLCSFLADLHASINRTFALPADLQRNFRKRFEACLVLWARGAVSIPVFRDAVEELFVTLARARGGMIRRDLYELLGSPCFTESELLSTLAITIRKRLGE